MSFVMQLEKRAERRLDAEVMRNQLAYIVGRALAGARGKVWALKTAASAPRPREEGDSLVYATRLVFERVGRAAPPDVLNRQWLVIRGMAEAAGRSRGWELSGKNEKWNQQGEKEEKKPEPRGYTAVTLPEGIDRHFGHIFDRQPQIEMVKSAIEEFVQSEMENRFHCVLHGAPASGKTEILLSFARWLGPDAILHFDGTSTTKAGAEKVLLETASIPPILIVEEIEKTEEASLRWMLGVLDHRAEVRKITYNRGIQRRSVKLLCLATVNDMALFERVMDGALASRFAHKVFCPRPSRELLEKILTREIARRKGRLEWIKPTLDYCMDVEGTTDPRRITAVCMSGKDRWLDGSYRKFLTQTTERKSS